MEMAHVPPELLLALALAAALLAVVQSVRLAFRAWLPRRRLALARERGALGEVRAEILLRRLGYTVLRRQAVVRYGLGVDGTRVAIDLRADYLVSERGRRYVAEVKTGNFAPRIETAATRRQLLEYRVAFDVDGVLLVDAEAGRVQKIQFPLLAAPPSGRLVWLFVGLAAGALGALAARGG